MIRRILGWGLKRAGFGSGGPASTGAGAIRSAVRQLQPGRRQVPFRAWLHGESAAPMSFPPDEIRRAAEAGRLRRPAAVYFLCALIAAVPLTLVAGSGGALLALGPLTAAVVMFLLGLHRDYLAWLMAEGRPHPPIAYLRQCPRILFRR